MVSILRYRTAMGHLIQIQSIYIYTDTKHFYHHRNFCWQTLLQKVSNSTRDNELQPLPNTEQQTYTTAPCQKKKRIKWNLWIYQFPVFTGNARDRGLCHTMGIQSANSRLWNTAQNKRSTFLNKINTQKADRGGNLNLINSMKCKEHTKQNYKS